VLIREATFLKKATSSMNEFLCCSRRGSKIEAHTFKSVIELSDISKRVHLEMILEERLSLLVSPKTEEIEILKLHLQINRNSILFQRFHLFSDLIQLCLNSLF
jgi:hypothetical protein